MQGLPNYLEKEDLEAIIMELRVWVGLTEKLHHGQKLARTSGSPLNRCAIFITGVSVCHSHRWRLVTVDMWVGLGDLQAGNSALGIQSQQIPTEMSLRGHTVFRNTQRKYRGGLNCPSTR